MRTHRWLPAATFTVALSIAGPALPASAETVPAANAGAPFAVEDAAYPFRSSVLAVTGADLIAGDGNITHTSCSGPYQIMVWARNLLTNDSRICFKAANTGYLAVNIPRAYRIETNDRDLAAKISIAGETSSLTVPKDTSKGFGEADPADPQRAVLLEMRITGSSAAAAQPSGDNTYAFTGKLAIGDNKRFCSATLIDPRWVLAAKSCFADNPAEDNTVAAGAPKEKTTLTVGRADLATTGGHTTEIVELVPRTDRDLVMARLEKPAFSITPAPLSSKAPTTGEELTVAAFGRTASEWAPSKVHTAVFGVGAVDATGFDLAAKTAGVDSVCKGDAGAPALRTENGKPTVAALTSRSWQEACLDGGDGSKAGAYDTRVDDIGAWIAQVAAPRNSSQVSVLAGGGGTMWSQSGDLGYGEYGQAWSKADGKDITRVTSVRSGEYLRAYGIAGGKVYGQDLNVRTGQWSGWSEIPGGAAGTRDITAAIVNNVVYLQIAGADGSLYTQVGDYNAGRWNTGWTNVSASGLTSVTSLTAGTTVRLYAVADGRVYGRDLNTQNGSWTGWGELPGGAAGVKDIGASLVGNNVELQIVGADGAVWMQYGNYDAGHWNTTWTKAGGTDLTRLSSSPVGKSVNVYAVGASGKVLNATLESGPGTWTAWKELPGGLAGANDVSATAVAAPSKVSLAAGSQGTLFSQKGDLATGAFDAQWAQVGGVEVTRLTSVTATNHIRYYGIAGGKVYGRDLDTRTNTWSGWGEIPGGAAGARDITAAIVNNVVYLQIAGSGGSLHTQVGDYNAGRWNTGWANIASSGLTGLTSVAAGTTVRLYAVADGRVYGRDLNTQNGSWTGWGELPGGAAGVKDIAASLVGNNTELQIVGGNGGLWTQYGNYDAGRWNTAWTDAGGTGLTRVTSTPSGKNVHVYTVGASGRVQGSILVSGPGTWTAWKELPGGLAGTTDVTATTGK
ncbi:trypsin-like serine protease [Streptomyces sp. NPDC101118]|uniref:trypsin-like serine protease n=1 Tax=Streptomyces sp. NPDC101118 TaxID=3366109 RepID=UPI0038004F45